MFHTSYKIGPTKTPIIIKIILGITIFLSVLNALTLPFLKTNILSYLFGLSLSGAKNYYFWQLLTYNFLQPSIGFNINFIFDILFNLYLLWVIGVSLIDRISQLQYIIFYILSSLFSASVMLFIMSLGYPAYIFTGISISLYSTLMAWMMLNPPDTRIFLFFAIPMKHYYLVLGLIGINLFTSLSHYQMVNFCGYIASVIFSYFYSVIIWSRFSPFQSLNKMESLLINLFRPLINKFRRKF